MWVLRKLEAELMEGGAMVEEDEAVGRWKSRNKEMQNLGENFVYLLGY